MNKKFLTLEEVADMLNVNYQLVYRLVRAGDLPAIKLGRVYRVEENDLMEYLSAKKTDAIAETCSSCSKTFSSRLSLKHHCTDCGALICNDCWMRLKLNKCLSCR